ncbi:hypothetical protein [Ramlibacter sp. WS9]|uniref:hypothetical protein n=1 Tax=Ramlibacter sp. WS9 TaxID=1882741 RepID=UPI0011416A35|nr:hypothetical protein [Ramlibacter sp. WS9]ROZ61475.1 hypothetical protein EEB15_32630 [Ramlibacter sp. WS9]
MDKTQIATIAITAIVSVVAKEVVTWLVSLAKNASAAKSLAAKAKAIFTRSHMEILASLLALMFYAGVLVNFARTDTPPTRLEILLIVGAVFAMLFVGLNLLWEIAKLQIARKKNAP